VSAAPAEAFESLAGRLRALRNRIPDPRRLPAELVEPLRGARALEVGGPTGWFRSGGLLPVYSAVAELDGINFATDTLWESSEDAVYAPEGEPTGRMWIREAADLGGLPSEHYDAVLASHVIEHLADPIAGLREWMRVLRPGGHLLLVVPHKERTHDRRRPVTPLTHMVEDHERGVGEDDDTHFDEVIRLHDMRLDRGAGSDVAAFERRTRENAVHRAVHHHVFVTGTVLELLDHCGLEVRAAVARRPHDIFCLARKPEAADRPPDNARWLAPDAEWRARSPFRLDGRPGAQAPRS
jgi:SAM-dependent methyltransferase